VNTLSKICEMFVARNVCSSGRVERESILNYCYPLSGQNNVRSNKIKMKRFVLLLPLFAAVYLFAFATPPVYPGAKAVDELNVAAKVAGQNTVAYNTADPFEKVYEFYKAKGTDVPRAHRAGPREKFAMVMFNDTGYRVAISWKEDSKDKGTIIHIGK